MPKSKQQKDQEVKKIKDQLSQTKGIIFADYTGLKVGEVQELRSKLKETNSSYSATKKTFLKIAFKNAGFDNVNIDSLPGAVSITTNLEDEVAPAKVLFDFAKTHEALKIQGGILENNFIDAAKVKELAKLPSKLELLAKVVGSIKSPISGFVNVLSGNLRNLVYILAAIQKTKNE